MHWGDFPEENVEEEDQQSNEPIENILKKNLKKLNS